MKSKAQWILALLIGGLVAAPAVVAEGQPARVPRIKKMPIQHAPSGQRTTSGSAPQPLSPTVVLPGGSFQMGANEGDADAKPAHAASVATFKIDVNEVTTADYKKCVDAGKCTVPRTGDTCNWGVGGKEGHPVNCVDWYQAEGYCGFVGMRLPTEQEWEFAARHPDGRAYPWGAAAPTNQACWKKTDGTCSVGSIAAGKTSTGINDMAGNVAEWTSGPFCPYGSGGCTTTQRAVRGGGWSLANPDGLAAASRDGYLKGVRSATIGFRCVGNATP
jgi:formylglycine-generating enzyme required for sulfatase activity